jgi:ankyrin repeat protein
VGVKTDIKMRVGAWSWDMETGEEFRVGAGLAEPYPITWCAVEYFEATGAILHMLLQHLSPNTPHYGRTLIHHAILCNNAKAVDVMVHCGADVGFLEKPTSKSKLRPIHLATSLGFSKILQCLISVGCNLNSRTESGETALMVCARYKHEECLKILASAGADFGLVNTASQCASSIAHSARWTSGFQQAVVDVILADKVVRSSNTSIFSPLLFVVQANELEALKNLVRRTDVDLDEQNADGFSAAMIAATRGHVEAFRLLVYAGADIELHNKYGETAMDLFKANKNSETFEKLMIEYVLERGNGGSFSSGFYALHRAAFLGDINSVRKFTFRGYDVNALDDDGYTPLMLAAMRGHGQLCGVLISCGARCDVENERHETALMLARKNGCRNGAAAERVIFDELARTLVLDGGRIKKHTKCGKGAPHGKVLRMVGNVGVLQWGKSSKRNVICQWAEVGPSAAFRRNRRRKFDADEPGMFHVVTAKNKVLHFVCDGGVEMAELWVRGIEIVTREAIFGKQKSSL